MRLFIALEFDKDVIRSLRQVQDELKEEGLEGRYTSEDNLHLTLAFIGEYDDPDKVLAAMRKVPFGYFRIKMSGIGCFGDLYWIGTNDDPYLVSYVRRLRRELSLNDIPFDAKRFRPHITLVRKGINKNNILSFGSKSSIICTIVRSVTLFRSESGENGMVYTVLGRADGESK